MVGISKYDETRQLGGKGKGGGRPTVRLSREIAFLHICIHRFDQVDSIIDILCKYQPQELVLVENYETLAKLPRGRTWCDV